MDGYDPFITFTNNYSHYGYIYPIKEISEVLDKFEIFSGSLVAREMNCEEKQVHVPTLMIQELFFWLPVAAT